MVIRWSGWGILALPLIIGSAIGGPFAAVSLLHDLAVQGDDGIDHGGVPFGGLALGLLVGGGVIYLLGVALNRRRSPDGSWFWTDRHELGEFPVESVGRFVSIVGLLAIPLSTVQFVPAAVVWTLVIVWAALVTTGLVVLSRRQKAKLGAVTR
jgi:hypothetical protein